MTDTADGLAGRPDDVFAADEGGLAALERLSGPFVIIDEEGAIRFANAAAQALLAVDTKDSIAAHFTSPPKERAPDQIKVFLHDDTELVLQEKRTPARWQGARAALVALHDVTRYVAAVQKMRTAKRRHTAVLDGIPVANYLVVLGDTAATLFISPYFEELLGHPRDSWRDEPALWRKFVHEDDRDRVMDDFKRSLANREGISAEYRVLTRAGDVVWVREESRFVADPQQLGAYLAGVLIDISKDKHGEEELSSYRDFLEQQAIVRARELERAEQQLADETARRKALEAELAGVQAASAPSAQDAHAQIEQLEQGNAQLRLELERAQERIAALEAEPPAAAAPDANAAASLAQLRRELDDARRAEVELRAGREHAAAQSKAHTQELEARIESLRHERDEIQRTVVEMKAGREHAEAQSRERADEIQRNAEALRRELDSLRPKYAELEATCRELEAHASALAMETQERIAGIQKQLDDSHCSAGALEAALQARDEELRQAREQTQNEAGRAEEAHGRMADLQKQLDD
ncbi:MAG: PAS domain-containing protein, partial [Pseudomonadota bacterium]